MGMAHLKTNLSSTWLAAARLLMSSWWGTLAGDVIVVRKSTPLYSWLSGVAGVILSSSPCNQTLGQLTISSGKIVASSLYCIYHTFTVRYSTYKRRPWIQPKMSLHNVRGNFKGPCYLINVSQRRVSSSVHSFIDHSSDSQLCVK